jgi:L-ribulose-5-phosphate 3-epimerase
MGDALNRRHFLKVGGGTLAAAVLGTAAGAADEAPAKRRAIKKAVMYGTMYEYPGSVLDKFRAIKAAGFEGVEPMSHMPQNEVMDALEKTGLKAASVCCKTHWDKPLSDPREKVRKEGLEGLLLALKDAQRYGATSVLLVPGVVNKQVSYDDCFQRCVAEIRKAIPQAKDLGVKIAIENVWNEFITKPEQAKDLLDAIDSEYVGWHFDIGNTVRYNDPETWIPVIGKRILKLHIKEYSRKKAKESVDPYKGFAVRLTEGSNHWPAIMKALDEAGYEGWGISEQPGDQSKNAAALKDLSERMSRIFAS